MKQFDSITNLVLQENLEPEDHKQRMKNIAAEIAGIATRISMNNVRSDDGDRLLELAEKIQTEYN
jgi:hypothetical protein